MQGLESFNITVVGANFPVQQAQIEDFDFNGQEPEVQLRLQQVLQARAGDYALAILPERFQVGVLASQATPERIDVLKRATLTFINEYGSHRSLIAIGHNFTGTFTSVLGTASDFMKHIAWRDDFAAAMEVPSDPTLSLTSSVEIGDGQTRTLRVEPRTKDPEQVFYDLNFNWGSVDEPIGDKIRESVEHFNESLKLGGELIERLASLGGSLEGVE